MSGNAADARFDGLIALETTQPKANPANHLIAARMDLTPSIPPSLPSGAAMLM